ncbi:hypothetical protein DASC09_017220 [Saccharomycopsis crataegensis]|uniref:Uncharacterized protein n=1 Tax=Saccharomycopsis crataegensis TaxID=43959 RepID=A0AAV5QII0_9ASCO|nr:hypothetical protein DASC09_017220 [Saccharomycopsis crataegensis]
MSFLETAKATITKSATIIKDVSKYTVTPQQLQNIPPSLRSKTLYRRFIRLTPFISQQKSIKSSYQSYVRSKFVSDGTGDVHIPQGDSVVKPSLISNENVKTSLNTLYLLQNMVSDNPTYRNPGKHLILNILDHFYRVRWGQTRKNAMRKNSAFQRFLKMYNERYDLNL